MENSMFCRTSSYLSSNFSPIRPDSLSAEDAKSSAVLVRLGSYPDRPFVDELAFILDVARMLTQLIQGHGTTLPERPLPCLPVDGADHMEVINVHIGMLRFEDLDFELQFVPMGDDELARCAVPAREPQR